MSRAAPLVWNGEWWEVPCLKVMLEKGMEVVIPYSIVVSLVSTAESSEAGVK